MGGLPQKRKAEPGTVSSGTLRTEDLLPAFYSELEELDESAARVLAEEHPIVEAEEPDWDSDDAMWALEALQDALQEYAPEGHYFGAHIGDGADFGFWPGEEE